MTTSGIEAANFRLVAQCLNSSPPQPLPPPHPPPLPPPSPLPPPPQPPPHNRRPHHRHRHRRRRCRRRRHNHYHHHHVAKIELGHLFTRSGLTILEVSIMVSSGFFCLRSVVFYYPCNLLLGILFICCNQFLLYSSILSRTGVTLIFFCNFGVCFTICPSVSCCVSHIFNLCCCYSSCVSCFNDTIFTTV